MGVSVCVCVLLVISDCGLKNGSLAYFIKDLMSYESQKKAEKAKVLIILINLT